MANVAPKTPPSRWLNPAALTPAEHAQAEQEHTRRGPPVRMDDKMNWERSKRIMRIWKRRAFVQSAFSDDDSGIGPEPGASLERFMGSVTPRRSFRRSGRI